LKHGIKNAVAINGTSVPDTIFELAERKVVTLFVDGDRGGDLIIKEVTSVADVDYVCRAPDGKEVEEITKKEIHKAIRSRVSGEQAKLESSGSKDAAGVKKPDSAGTSRPDQRQDSNRRPQQVAKRPVQRGGAVPPKVVVQEAEVKLTEDQKGKYGEMLEDLIGTRGAYILDEKLKILGKVPLSELSTTIRSLSGGAYSVILDGMIDKDLVQVAEKSNVKFLVAMDSKVSQPSTRVKVLTSNDL